MGMRYGPSLAEKLMDKIGLYNVVPGSELLTNYVHLSLQMSSYIGAVLFGTSLLFDDKERQAARYRSHFPRVHPDVDIQAAHAAIEELHTDFQTKTPEYYGYNLAAMVVGKISANNDQSTDPYHYLIKRMDKQYEHYGDSQRFQAARVFTAFNLLDLYVPFEYQPAEDGDRMEPSPYSWRDFYEDLMVERAQLGVLPFELPEFARA